MQPLYDTQAPKKPANLSGVLPEVERKTILSACRQYRYCLWREWNGLDPSYALFVGLNPSTADEVQDDPTIRRCIGFAKRWGYGAMCVVNIFAYRATDPAVLKAHANPVGVDNDRWLLECAREAGVIVVAWGTNGRYMQRDQAVKQLLAGGLWCLGRTRDGYPRHPLYVKADVRLCDFPLWEIKG